MDDLISLIFFVVVGVISIIAKIVNSKKEKDALLVRKVPVPGKIMRKTQSQLSSVPSVTAKSTLQNNSQWRLSESNGTPVNQSTQQKQKESLITEEEEVAKTAEPQSEPILITEENKIAETAIGTQHNSVAQSIKKELKFAVICHEILGKPKALQ